MKNLLKPSLLGLVLLLTLIPSSQSWSAPKSKKTVIESIEFRDISVADALRILTDQSDINIIASQEAAKVHITMFLHRVTPLQVIDAISKTYNLWYKFDQQSNIIRLYTVKEYRLEQVEFKQEKTESFTLKNAKNALDLADTVMNLYGSRVKLSFGENQNELVDDLYNRFERFDLIDSRTRMSNNNSNNNGNNSSSGGNNSNSNSRGGGGNASGNRGNNRNNNRSNRQNLSGRSSNRNFGNGINTNQQGFNNGALETFTQFSKDLQKNTSLENLFVGEAFQMNQEIIRQAPIYLSVIKRQNRVLVRTRDAEAMEDIKQLFHKLDTESSMMLMEVKILSLNLGDDFNSLFDFKIKNQQTRLQSGRASLSNITQSVDSVATLAGVATGNPALLATLVSDKFEARLQLLERENRVTELATPVLMTTNQEVSRVFIGEERPIITGYEASSNQTTNTATNTSIISNSILEPIIDIHNLGTTLLLTPNINADRTVSIRILIEQSGLSPSQVTIPVPLGGTLQNATVDVVQSKTFSGTVVAKDGAAIAVGGLIKEKAGDSEGKVPFLGDIPGLGFFFRDESRERGREELVVIIRPHIIATPAEASRTNRNFLQENSIHPNAQEADPMDVYSNDDQKHRSYKLEQPYKEHPLQDRLDKSHWNHPELRQPARPARTVQKRKSPDQTEQIYVELTQYAAKGVRVPANELDAHKYIKPEPLAKRYSSPLIYDTRIRALPVEAWRRGGIHVTAVKLYNTSSDTVTVDYKHLKGHWLASTIENAQLNKLGEKDDSTYLYLISSESFDDIAKRIAQDERQTL